MGKFISGILTKVLLIVSAVILGVGVLAASTIFLVLQEREVSSSELLAEAIASNSDGRVNFAIPDGRGYSCIFWGDPDLGELTCEESPVQQVGALPLEEHFTWDTFRSEDKRGVQYLSCVFWSEDVRAGNCIGLIEDD